MDVLQDNSAAAEGCRVLFEHTRNEILRSHPWNFAKKRATLSRLEADPTFTWTSYFQIPGDCLRILSINDTEIGDMIAEVWQIEGRKILSDDEDTLNIVYVSNATTPDEWDVLFVEAFAVKLAAKLSEYLRGTTTKTAELMEEYARLVAPLARRIDSNETRGKTSLLPYNSLSVLSRGGGSGVSSIGSYFYRHVPGN